MTSVELAQAPRHDWVLANSWPYALVGLGFTVLGWLWVLAAGDALDGLRVFLVGLGVLLSGVAVLLRFNTARPAYLQALPPESRNVILAGLTILFALTAALVTVLLLLTVPSLVGSPLISLKFGGLLYLWLAAAPVSLLAARACWLKMTRHEPVTEQEEGGALLVLAGFAAFCGCWALYDPSDPLRWDTLRTFLAAAVLVVLVSAPLVIVSQPARRLLVSTLFVLHFGGIFTAVLAAPPSPFIASQLWARIYRPYLEFMYLNNAYHFYAPEPGPASHLWFRMYYADPEGKLFAHWFKVPDIDDNGWPRYTVALEYQRMLAVTENAVSYDSSVSLYAVDANGQQMPTPALANRMYNAPWQQPPVVLGKQRPELSKPRIPIPFHPAMAANMQYAPPTFYSRQLLESYARHVGTLKHPDHPDWQFKSAKIYKAVHAIPLVAEFANGQDPRDPPLYRPYFLGEYDAQGKLLDPEEPLLYWLLPILRDMPTVDNPKPDIRNWAARHAGDPAWMLRYDPAADKYRPYEPDERPGPALNLELPKVEALPFLPK